MKTAYIHTGAIYCEACGEALAMRLKAAASNALPQAYIPELQATDYPHHCEQGAQCLSAIAFADGTTMGAHINERLSSQGYVVAQEEIDLGGPLAEFYASVYGNPVADRVL